MTADCSISRFTQLWVIHINVSKLKPACLQPPPFYHCGALCCIYPQPFCVWSEGSSHWPKQLLQWNNCSLLIHPNTHWCQTQQEALHDSVQVSPASKQCCCDCNSIQYTLIIKLIIKLNLQQNVVNLNESNDWNTDFHLNNKALIDFVDHSNQASSP